MLRKRNQKGMSYIEVAVCLFIVSISILPLSQSLLSSVKVREEAESISQSTFFAEDLLEQTKKQLQKDLMGDRTLETKYSNTTELYPLEEFFGFTEETAKEEFKNSYFSDRYTYEVAIWNIAKMGPIAHPEKIVLFDSEILNKAFRFYIGQEEQVYQFTSEEQKKLPMFNIKDYKHLFTDDLYFNNFSLDAVNNASQVIGVCTIELEEEGESNIDATISQSGKIKVDQPKVIQAVGTTEKVYVYHVENNNVTSSETGIGIIILDLRALDLVNLNKTIIQLKNISEFSINLKLLINKGQIPGYGTDSAMKLEDKIHIIISDNHIQKKTTLERITYLDREDDYLIAIVVRDKNPRLGNPGKIITTITDVFSFESPVD